MTATDDHLLTTSVPTFTLAWKALLLDHRVPDGAVRLYLVLATYARSDRPVAWPGQETLAAQMNVSLDTIQRHGRALVDTGWIEKVRRGRGRSNLYHLRMPGALAVVVDKPVETVDEAPLDTADVRLQETADLRLPYEVDQSEVVTPPTPRKRGARRRVRGEPLGPDERAVDFVAWWSAYPRKVSKIAAEQAWRQMLPRLPDTATLIAASVHLGERTAREHRESTEWQRYLPHPATWLRAGGWHEIDQPEPDQAPARRNPCVLCGVPNPCQETCLGVGKGLIADTTECIWR